MHPNVLYFQEFVPTEKDCPYCGLPKSYHESKTYKCLGRKKPYKLRDGTDVKLGMRIWFYHPWGDKLPGTGKDIITGIVRFIGKWGSIVVNKDKEDIELDPNHLISWGHLTANSSFSSLENAIKFRDKCLEEKRRLGIL